VTVPRHDSGELAGFDDEFGIDPEPRQRDKPGPGEHSARTERKYVDVLEVTRSLSSTLNVTKLLNNVVDGIIRVTKCERGFLYLKRPDGTFLRHIGRTAERMDDDQGDISQTIVNRVVEQGKPFIEPDLQRVDDLNSGSIHKHAIRSAICLPLVYKDEFIGVIYADSHFVVPDVLESDHSILEAFAAQAAVAIENARQHGELRSSRNILEEQNISLRKQLSKEFVFSGMVSKSKEMLEVFETVEKIASHDINVMITGESGTGKELMARAIHERSSRSEHNFETVNCAGIPEGLVESILFGHAKGAFTGADQDKRGVFEIADGGTLFLDEIGDMPLLIQPKILRALQDGEVRRVGEERVRNVDVRIVSATHVDLSRAVAEGKFRQDLYFRLNAAKVSLPALADRREDIVPLSEFFLRRYAEERNEPLATLSRGAREVLLAHSWPGNIRELKSAIEWGIVFQDDNHQIHSDQLRRFFRQGGPEEARIGGIEDGMTLKSKLLEYEERLIRESLMQNNFNITSTAKVLEISRQQLHNKIKKYRISTRHE